MKYRLLFLCLIIPLLASGQDGKYKIGESILQDDVRVVIPSYLHLIPFRDENTGLIGLVRNGSRLLVTLLPTYEDCYNAHCLLMAVQKNGKWGALDLGERYLPGEEYERGYPPIIPCIYDEVFVLDDYRARVTKDGKTEIIDIREGHMTMSEYFSPERDAERRRNADFSRGERLGRKM